MNLDPLVSRLTPEPWSEGDNLPWNEPGFSQRMLSEHLSQEHDAASRRLETIQRHVQFIHNELLSSCPAHILDLGCGPGLYSEQLARLGHTCRGIDFSPASIAFASQVAARENLDCSYLLSDLRQAEFGNNYDLLMLLYGEFNVFRPADARLILEKALAALKPGGQLLLEPSPAAYIQRLGQAPPTWYSSPGGLFDPGPHLVLSEAFWHEQGQAATVRWFVLSETSSLRRYAASYQAYANDDFQALLESCGFSQVRFLPSLLGAGPPAADFIVILSSR